LIFVRTAIVSDIHGNLEALQSVLADIQLQRCDRIVCLGDIIGYGPNPCECLDIVAKVDICVLGNHDYGALIDPEGFSAAAEQAIFWTRRQLENSATPEESKRRLEFLARLPRTITEGNLLFVHGSVRNPLNEYVFPEDVFNRRKMEKLFSMVINVGSVGQPRDGDWRSCYLILDDTSVEFRRVEYDINKTVEKIFAIPELDNFLGERLREGR